MKVGDDWKPDFFVVGAPKSGTTALCRYLNQHPAVFIPDFIAPRYFGRDQVGQRPAQTIDDYRAMYDGHEAQRCGDGTPHYLASTTAAREIYDFNPAAKIIAMLRNPLEIVPALHNQVWTRTDLEPIHDFEDLAPQLVVREGQDIHYRLKYLTFGRLHTQVQRFLDVFPPGQVRLVLYDDFAADTAGVYRRLLDFLDLPTPPSEPDFVVHNARKEVRSQLLLRLIFNRRLQRCTHFFLPRPARDRIGRLLIESNLRRGHRYRRSISTASRQIMLETLESEIDGLSSLLHRDLSHWKRSSTESAPEAER